MSDRIGSYLYVGKTQSGKTTAAMGDLDADAAELGWPKLILDMMPAKNFVHLQHEKDVDQVLQRLYGRERMSVSIFTPDEEALDRDFDPLIRAILAEGRVCILLDEIRTVGSWRSIRKTLTKLIRGWAHAGRGAGYTLRATAQRPQDIHDDVWACDPTVYGFRMDASAVKDLVVMRDRFGWTESQLSALGRGERLSYEARW